jgi:hypothetical protein
VTQLPWLRSYAGNILLVTGARHSRAFTDNFDGTYSAKYFYKEGLVANTGSQEFVFTDTQGNRTIYHDFTVVGKQGKFKEFRDAAGNVTTVTYTSDKVTSVSRSTTVGADTFAETWTYTYDAAPNDGRWANVLLTQTLNGGAPSNVRQVNYTYYADGTLQRAVIKDSDLSTTIETKYYRYYGVSFGFYGLKYVFSGKDYERLKNAVGGTDAAVDAASDPTVEPYAGLYFEYDGFARVTKEVVQGQGCG